ncbi:MAG: flippase-like domain-containing protein [Polyangiaceae bacterium]|nr:flippase-like domain-containing protein [Polyangiaceae bacterium]
MNRRSIVRGIQIIVGITLATFAYLTFDSFRSNPEGVRIGFSNLKPGWLLLGAVLALQEGVCGGLRIWSLSRVLYPALRVRTAIISEFVLMFAAGVTPGQAGAAPAQVAVLMTGGMKFADVATVELLVASCSITFFLLSALLIFVLGQMGLFVVHGNVPIGPLLGVGVTVFGTFLVLLIFSAAYPPLAKGVVRAFAAILAPPWHALLRLLTKIQRTRAWAEKAIERRGELRARMLLTVDDFHHGFRVYAKRGKTAYFVAFLLTFGFFCSRFAVAYFILLGLGLPVTPSDFVTIGPPIVQVILVQALLNFVLYLSPIPSAGGLAETSSRAVMSKWVPQAFEVPYVLVWRLLTQFLCMFVGGMYVFRYLGADVLESQVEKVEAEKRAHEDHARASQRSV